ncbi:MAG TPA: putative selenium-dependent hydroxylase accessory protein YqeC [Desulfobulbus sp.]|nr:putative selenium-dependent hydroxylase accessory protein YqeC [Desulfobulbus sp.]
MPGLCKTLVSPEDLVIAIVGAGGKTSLMFSLARSFADRHHKIITTTTTRIRVPTRSQSGAVVLFSADNFWARLEKILAHHSHATVANRLLPDDKLKGLSPELLTKILAESSADHMIIEADGARGLSLKAPDDNEPVIPEWADICIAVAGLDCIGRPLTKLHAFRPKKVAAITGLAPGDTITPDALARLAVHPQGMLKGCPSASRSLIFFNKTESTKKQALARQIIALANTLPGNKPDAWTYGSIRNNTCTIQPAA